MSTVLARDYRPEREFPADCQLDPLVLSIQVPNQEPRIVRIDAEKCMIGSAANCNLRIVGPRIQPIHCSILRGAQGICFRRWAGQVALNGEDFEESTLCCGDRLTLGTIELEVITDGLPVTPAPRRCTPPAP
ncbi:MAG: hypothetical protein FJ295_01535 [Planctomycetes bacterium]|nr:hypothetical protein [Planctomycetota bacterium]